LGRLAREPENTVVHPELTQLDGLEEYCCTWIVRSAIPVVVDPEYFLNSIAVIEAPDGRLLNSDEV
jgi:hypothetical protein